MAADRPFPHLPAVLPKLTLAERLRLVRGRWRLLVRLAGATALAYAFSTHVLGHEQAFFAPVAAVVVLLGGVGLRHRMLVDLILGVAIGVLVTEGLIHVIGRGTWQLALVVVLVTASAVFSGLKGVALTQAANSGVLLTAIVPVVGAANPAVTRFADSLVGGLAALVLLVLFPRNARRDLDLEVRPLLASLQGVLTTLAESMRNADPAAAQAALTRARGLQGKINSAITTAANAREAANLSPTRWRQREDIERYTVVLGDIDNAIRDARVLARRVGTMMRLGENPGAHLAAAVDGLAEGVGVFQDVLADPGERARAEKALINSVKIAMDALTDEMTLNRAAVAAQVRSLAADVLFAGGMTRDELDVRLRF
ncbi:FUSC family protein [Nocardioides yefusunii]|uniref:FUSC family protein n=1 Tax=Nocardioides yefusunii TaxID=2500546 RepID=A0ABW1R2V1_9ACTN|nr:FUSC family protein [Nocardioides yefusunii]